MLVFAKTTTTDYNTVGTLTQNTVNPDYSTFSFLLTESMTKNLNLGGYYLELKIVLESGDTPIIKPRIDVFTIVNSLTK